MKKKNRKPVDYDWSVFRLVIAYVILGILAYVWFVVSPL